MSENEKQQKRVFLVKDKECFALSHFIFVNQNQVFVPVSSTVKIVNVANYHITEAKLFASHQLLVTSHQLLVISRWLLLLVTTYQLLVASYQSLVTSHQLLVTSYYLILVTSSQLIMFLVGTIFAKDIREKYLVVSSVYSC